MTLCAKYIIHVTKKISSKAIKRKKMKILLVAPQFEASFSNSFMKSLFFQAKTFVSPMHLATIAALTPDDIEVDLWDEPVHGWIDENTKFDAEYDLVGIVSQLLTLQRSRTIANILRKRGIPVAANGPGVSAAPERYKDDFDILFVGEVELTWPQFIADWKTGNYQQEYRQETFIDMSLSPPPRWDSIADQMQSYLMGGIETSRGCTFECKFCRSHAFYGNQIRHKPIDRILKEIVTLESLGLEGIYFCDSNFIGDASYTKDLLRELISLNNSFEEPLSFHGELTIDVAQDAEMLSLLADANFGMLNIGIESPNEESLKEAKKIQNLRGNLSEDCRKIMSYGLEVVATMIVGFDHDTTESFDQIFEFIQEAYIPCPIINLLQAADGTTLWNRLFEENRLLDINKSLYDEKSFLAQETRAATNIIPKNMTRAELFSGYLNLLERVYDWSNFSARTKEFISNIKRQPNVSRERKPPGRLSAALNAFLLSLTGKAKSATFSTFLHVRQHAPFMMRRTGAMIGKQYIRTAKLPHLRETITKQIEFEASIDINHFIVE
jgi:radical SAM superfamily enzyme YgiQ (UPF0313 family)